jgi:hypothetical protein
VVAFRTFKNVQSGRAVTPGPNKRVSALLGTSNINPEELEAKLDGQKDQ